MFSVFPFSMLLLLLWEWVFFVLLWLIEVYFQMWKTKKIQSWEITMAHIFTIQSLTVVVIYTILTMNTEMGMEINTKSLKFSNIRFSNSRKTNFQTMFYFFVKTFSVWLIRNESFEHGNKKTFFFLLPNFSLTKRMLIFEWSYCRYSSLEPFEYCNLFYPRLINLFCFSVVYTRTDIIPLFCHWLYILCI